MSPVSPDHSGRLSRAVLRWSLKSIVDHGVNSLFQRPFEFSIFKDHETALVEDLSELRVDYYRWSKPRRMVVPKDQYSFRLATQLDPMDALILTGIVKSIGLQIETRRIGKEVAFSHRFTDHSEKLYNQRVGWPGFWRESKSQARDSAYVVQTDISDFYGQISHQEIMRQLRSCEVPERLCAAIEAFLVAFGGEHGRGVPVGPHCVHLLAESSLIRADRLMEASGHRFLRYIDDYHLFCSSHQEATLALFDVASIIRGEFGLALNRGKTTVLPSEEVEKTARRMIREVTPRAREEAFLKLLEEMGAEEDSYQEIDLEAARRLDPDAISDSSLREILTTHLKAEKVDYQHLGWLLRRFKQVGAPGAVPVVLENFDQLAPVVGDAAQYLAAAGENWDRGLRDLGARVLEHAEGNMVKRSPYLEMVLFGLFGLEKGLNHFPQLARRFDQLSSEAKREVIMAARQAGAGDWLHALRKKADTFDPWMLRAFVHAVDFLPAQQKAECLEMLDADARSTDSVVLGALLADRSKIDLELWREPAGPAWTATRLLVAQSRREFVTERLELLSDDLAANVYGDVGDGELLVATWNLRNFGGGSFGFGERLPESFMYIARVLLGFDLVALQEIRSSENVDQLLGLLGSGWSKVICGEAPGRSGNSEMSAFLYRTRRLEFVGEVEQLVLSKSALIEGEHQFARPPFLATFRTRADQRSKGRSSTVIACTAHVYFGAASGAKYDRRVKEIKALVKHLVARARKARSTLILLGDLNVVEPGDPTMEPLDRADISLARSYMSPTNVGRNRFYTQIAFRPTQDGPRLRRTGVFDVYERVYRDQDQAKYLRDMKSSKAWDSRKRRTAQIEIPEFYRKWRTYQLSDHLPLWAELVV